jgi:hypothetical protein
MQPSDFLLSDSFGGPFYAKRAHQTPWFRRAISADVGGDFAQGKSRPSRTHNHVLRTAFIGGEERAQWSFLAKTKQNCEAKVTTAAKLSADLEAMQPDQVTERFGRSFYCGAH